jgi:hypothetical protein
MSLPVVLATVPIVVVYEVIGINRMITRSSRVEDFLSGQ